MATNEVIIKHKVFTYYVDAKDDATGRDVRVERLARRGETIKVDDATFARGSRADINAFETKEDAKAEEGAFDATTASLDETADWIRDEKPNVQETVDAAKGDADTARKLLDAEAAASGGDTRVGVEEGLLKVIQDANE